MGELNKMRTAPMPRLVFDMSWPLMISLLVQSLYNIVDSIFVARISEDALTTTSLAFPVQLLMIAFSVGTSVGINAILSQSIGAQKKEETGVIATTGVILSLVGTLLFMVPGLACCGSIVRLFTDDAELGELCRQYLSICMIFCVGTFIGTMFQRFLQAVGDTFSSMITLVAGALTNIVLGPILIFGLLGLPEMGIVGAAIATVIGQWVTAILAVWLNRTKNPTVKLKFHGYRPSPEILGKIFKVGLPTIIMEALGSVMVIAMNKILIPFSTTAVAFFGVYYKLQNFLFLPTKGLGQATIPIAGYSYGSRNMKRVDELMRVTIPAAAVIAVVASVIFFAIPGPLLSLFSASEEMLSMGVPALRIIAPTFIFASVTTVLGYIMSGLGNGMINMLGTAFRQFLVLIPCAYLLARAGGIQSVWYSLWVSELVAFLYAVIHSRHILKVLKEKK
ncbi:MAG: MATE family efflux transporter [Clostridiales bacterium]|nr:MATE family efflux transporter [Clostridiales bacterium]